MTQTTLLDKKTFQENILLSLEPRFQTLKGTKAYDSLVDAFYDYLKAPGDEKRQVLYHAKEVLEDCAYFELKRQKGPSVQDCGWGSL